MDGQLRSGLEVCQSLAKGSHWPLLTRCLPEHNMNILFPSFHGLCFHLFPHRPFSVTPTISLQTTDPSLYSLHPWTPNFNTYSVDVTCTKIGMKPVQHMIMYSSDMDGFIKKSCEAFSSPPHEPVLSYFSFINVRWTCRDITCHAFVIKSFLNKLF